MKLNHVKIENFKGIEHLDHSLRTEAGDARKLTCVVGDNGSGKTSFLQAIALPLALATRRIRHADQLDWHGFLLDRVSSAGPTRIELDVQFDSDELRITNELFKKWHDSLDSDFLERKQITAPSQDESVKLIWEKNRLSSPGGIPAIHQFLGRYYVKSLSKADPALRQYYGSIGDIFWFDQHRNLGSSSARRFASDDSSQIESWQTGVENLRDFLIGWWSYHTSPNKSFGKDYIPELEALFQCVFPDRRFVGTAPRGTGSDRSISDFYFLIQAGTNIYDLAEMSSGEQAIFPLLYEFVRLEIKHSIVLIDELELHLHPPEQQRLLRSLAKIGPECQFFITSHSAFIADSIPDDKEIRMESGVRCL